MSLLWGDIFSRWGLPLCLPDNIFKWFGVPTYIFNFIFPYSFLQFVRVNFDNAIFETILIQNFSSKMSLTFSTLTKHKKACFNRIIRRSVIQRYDRIEFPPISPARLDSGWGHRGVLPGFIPERNFLAVLGSSWSFLFFCNSECLLPQSHFCLKDTEHRFRARPPRPADDHGLMWWDLMSNVLACASWCGGSSLTERCSS